MTIGFSGTRKGMSEAQRAQLHAVIDWLWTGRRDDREFRHGAAIGADLEAADIAVRWSGAQIVPHPANGNPLARNRAIVAASDILIAAPESDTEQQRSGTWATVRYARAKGIPIVMLSSGTR
jgi:hypothetical protein